MVAICDIATTQPRYYSNSTIIIVNGGWRVGGTRNSFNNKGNGTQISATQPSSSSICTIRNFKKIIKILFVYFVFHDLFVLSSKFDLNSEAL